jgi:sialic acid synthase SpsE/sugar phosphate isomerase/epimerase
VTRLTDFAIGGRPIGPAHPVYVIAEIGVNHNGNPAFAHKLVEVAAAARCDAVKLQRRSMADLYVAPLLSDTASAEQSLQYMVPLLRDTELADEDFVAVKEHAESLGLTFLCTPFDIPSLRYLESLDLSAYKIGSPDLTNLPLIEAVARVGKPMLLSTGMSSHEEVLVTVDLLDKLEAVYALLHCSSTYPTPFEEVNLRYMMRLMELGVPVGYSGHERGIAISTAAVAMGACIIERHVTLDRMMVGPDHAASLEPVGLEKLVRDIRNLESAMGSGRKHTSRMEVLNREVLGKSLYAAKDIASGETITRDAIAIKGPAKGLSPQMIDKLVGRTALRPISDDGLFLPSDLGIVPATRTTPDNLGMWGFVLRTPETARIEELRLRMVEVRLTDRDVLSPLPPITDHDLPLVVHLPEYDGRHLVDIASPVETTRKRSIESAKRAIERALEIAAHFRPSPRAVIHPTAASMEPATGSAPYMEALARSLDELDGMGLTLLPENLPPRPWYFGGEYYTCAFMDPEDIERFCKNTGRSICLDISHMALYCNDNGSDLTASCATLMPYTAHMHVADAYGIHGEGAAIGNGDIDFEALAPLVADFNGTWIPEIWQGHQNDFAGYYEALERLAWVWVLPEPS